MEETLDPKEMAGKLGIDPEQTEFTLEEKELEKVAGGASGICGEIGVVGWNCTSTGVSSGCSEIGANQGSDCTKNGL